MTVLSTEKNDNIDSFLVYNTDDYELSDFCVNVKITGIKSKETLLERIITPSKIMIWKIDNVYGLVDMYSKDPTLSNDIKQINNKIIEIAKGKKEPIDISILFYPDKQQKDIYMELFPTALNSFSEIDRSIPSSHMFTAQINVETKMNIHYQ